MTGTEAAKWKSFITRSQRIYSEILAPCTRSVEFLSLPLTAVQPQGRQLQTCKGRNMSICLASAGLVEAWSLQHAARSKDQNNITYSVQVHALFATSRGVAVCLACKGKQENRDFASPLYCNYLGSNWSSARWACKAVISQKALTSEVPKFQDLP